MSLAARGETGDRLRLVRRRRLVHNGLVPAASGGSVLGGLARNLFRLGTCERLRGPKHDWIDNLIPRRPRIDVKSEVRVPPTLARTKFWSKTHDACSNTDNTLLYTRRRNRSSDAILRCGKRSGKKELRIWNWKGTCGSKGEPKKRK